MFCLRCLDISCDLVAESFFFFVYVVNERSASPPLPLPLPSRHDVVTIAFNATIRQPFLSSNIIVAVCRKQGRAQICQAATRRTKRREKDARSKYVELAPGRVAKGFYAGYGIRLVDLESRNPDVLKEFPDTYAAVAVDLSR